MKRARFVAPARREFLSEVVYYNGNEPGLGTRFATAVEETATRAVAFPLTGSPASKSTRRVFVKGFPFSVVYRPDAEGIVIFAVARSRPLTNCCTRRGKPVRVSNGVMPIECAAIDITFRRRAAHRP